MNSTKDQIKHSTATDGKPPVSSSSYDDEMIDYCGGCGDYPCTCPDTEEDEDPFNHPIASNCHCGAYYWNVKKGRWMQSADCCC